MAIAARLIATAVFARIAFIGIPYDLMKLRPLGLGFVIVIILLMNDLIVWKHKHNVLSIVIMSNTGCPHSGLPQVINSLIDIKIKEREFKAMPV